MENFAPYKKLVLLLALVFLSGCAGKLLEDSPGTLVVNITTSPDMNPDHNGRPSPIVLYFYNLKSANAFNNAQFFDLYEDSQKTLGADFISQQEVEIAPGKNIQYDANILSLETNFVGVLAAYRDLDNAVWQGIVETPINTKTVINVQLNKLKLSVSQ